TQRALLNPWAQALLAFTYEAGSAEAATLLSDVQSAAIRSASGAHWERIDSNSGEAGAPFAEQNMVNDVTNSAIVLYVLAQRDPGAPLVADATRYLMARRGLNGSWDSTYASAWSLLALTEVMRGVGELGGEFTYSASLNSVPLVSGQAGGPDSLNPVGAQVSIFSLGFDFPNRLLIEHEAGPGRLYYRAGLRLSRPVEDVAPYEAGLSIRRTYNLRSAECTAGGCPPIQTAAAGQQVVVHLTLTAPTAMTHLIVEDYIPAGAEILDLSLLTSQQGFEPFPEGEMPPEPAGFDVRRPFADGWGQHYFSAPQIYDDHIAWAAEFLPSGSYELTYVFTLLQPGEYRALPARAWQFYFPDVQANSAGEIFTITP
ncbi:MAG TPA: hypothetical protein VLS48_05320, partial [Anaerolineales bacterium]|nr:hypothetical protein [Anaerolineales bacterium]